MNHSIQAALWAVSETIVSLIEQDAGFRQRVRVLAEELLKTTDRGEATLEDHTAPDDPPQIIHHQQDLGPSTRDSSGGQEEPNAQAHEHTDVRLVPGLISTDMRPSITDTDLAGMVDRCRLKAEGLRWAATRQRLRQHGGTFRLDIAPRDREILERARQIGCHLWMNRPAFRLPEELSDLDTLAGCFDALAEAIGLVQDNLAEAEEDETDIEAVLAPMAEAQSAVLAGIQEIDGPMDSDQTQAFIWLREVAATKGVYIARHMRLDDLADPKNFEDLRVRLARLADEARARQERKKSRRSHLNRLRYHAGLIAERRGSEHDWRKVAGAIDDLIIEGVAPSSLAIRDVLLPILDDMPDLDELPRGFDLALREIDRFLAGQEPSSSMPTAPEAPSEVIKAAELLQGKTVVLIGGERRRHAQEALERGLMLKELVWIETREHESFESFLPSIARPDVALVLLAIRWSSHSFGEIRHACEERDKPLVRLPGGYGPNQVAHQILVQAGDRLRIMKQRAVQVVKAPSSTDIP